MQKPSNKIVETIEESVLWEFEYNRLQSLFEMNQELSRAGRLFANYGISEQLKISVAFYFKGLLFVYSLQVLLQRWIVYLYLFKRYIAHIYMAKFNLF